ncbi:MAG: cupin domain-containing protein [Candidatus Paceibacterota bacterium]
MSSQKPYVGNIPAETVDNSNFRQVIYTGPKSQLVLMSLKPGEDIGAEVHQVDQFFRFEAGTGRAIVDGQDYEVVDGSALLVPAGASHNVENTGSVDLKFYTLYAPPNHIDGRIHLTKSEAEADTEDEEFGHRSS